MKSPFNFQLVLDEGSRLVTRFQETRFQLQNPTLRTKHRGAKSNSKQRSNEVSSPILFFWAILLSAAYHNFTPTLTAPGKPLRENHNLGPAHSEHPCQEGPATTATVMLPILKPPFNFQLVLHEGSRLVTRFHHQARAAKAP